jgi:hypothetical protein
MLEKTLSIDSFTVASGNPTNTHLGSPFSPLLASTVTIMAETPERVADNEVESIKVILYLELI